MSNKYVLLIGSVVCLSSVLLDMPYKLIAFIVGLLFIIVGGLVEESRKQIIEIPEQDVKVVEPIEVING